MLELPYEDLKLIADIVFSIGLTMVSIVLFIEISKYNKKVF